MGSTNASLLGRLGDLDDALAWEEFQARYRPRLLAWSMKKGLRREDAEDLSQDVLVKVVRRMPTFQYQPGSNFSGYLRTIWKHALADFLTERARRVQGTGDSGVHEQLHNLEGGDLTDELEDLFQRELLEEAMERVKPLVTPRDWTIFTDLVFVEKSGTEVGKEHGLSLAAVGMVKVRVQKKIAREVALLEGTPLPEDTGEP